MERCMEFLSMVTEEIGKLQVSTAGVTLVIGILNCFLGYRLLKAWISLAGFYMGVVLFYTLASYYTRNSLIQICAILVGGLFFGLVSFHIYRLGVFLLCMDIGTVICSILLQPKSSLAFMGCLGIGILVGLLGIAFVKPMVIINTALGGGFSIAVSVVALLKRDIDTKILILGTVLSVVGMIIQAIVSRDQDVEIQDDRRAES